jgi:transposase-like protein
LTSIPEEFTPQLRILVDRKTGTPLDARLAPETRRSLRKLARHEIVVAGRPGHVGEHAHPTSNGESGHESSQEDAATDSKDARWVQVPLVSANDFFQLLEPKLLELENLRDEETHNLEEAILDLGEAVENVVQPVRDGFETRRQVSYRDLYFWREMFRLYLETPIFYSETERKRGAITFNEAKSNLESYDQQLRTTGLLDKMKTPQAKAAAKQFLDLNVQILNIMHFQEMNSRAMTKILKKFNKRTHLEGQQFIKGLRGKYPAMMTLSKTTGSAGGFADSIARDLHAEIGSKVLSIVPQLDDWICPVCYGMAWRPVKLGCCRSVFCIRCIIHLQDTGMKKCPMCNSETVMEANGGNIDFETLEFLQKFFPMEVKKRQKENERAQLVRDHGEEFVKPGCVVM